MCDAAKTSVEHVPPKGIFPKSKDLSAGSDLRKKLITVPSCDVHNTEKSLDDEYFIQNNSTAATQFNTKITRALIANPAVAKLITQNQQPMKVEDTRTGEVHETLALRIDARRVHQALDHIGRALHFQHFKSKWSGHIQVIPLFLLSLEGEAPEKFNEHLQSMGSAVEALMANEPHFGENPEVFTYKVLKLGQQIRLAMLLHFYEGSKVVLLFKNQEIH